MDDFPRELSEGCDHIDMLCYIVTKHPDYLKSVQIEKKAKGENSLQTLAGISTYGSKDY